MGRSIVIVLLVLLSLSVVTCLAQKQEYVGRWDASFGFSYMTTPNMNLDQRGWHGQFGYNWNRWLAVGFDTSYFGGGSSVTVPQLNNATLVKLAPIFPYLPAGYTVYAPYHANTYTITGGPQLNYRGLKWTTLFIHPDIGAMHQSVQVKPIDPIQAAIAKSLLGSSMKTSEWVPFFGVGGGVDLNFTKHVGVKLNADWVRTTFFNDVLKNPQYTWRLSVLPTVHFGKNVPQ